MRRLCACVHACMRKLLRKETFGACAQYSAVCVCLCVCVSVCMCLYKSVSIYVCICVSVIFLRARACVLALCDGVFCFNCRAFQGGRRRGSACVLRQVDETLILSQEFATSSGDKPLGIDQGGGAEEEEEGEKKKKEKEKEK